MSDKDRNRLGEIITESQKLAPTKVDAATENLRDKLSNLKGQIGFVDEQTAIQSLKGMQDQLGSSVSGLQEAYIAQKSFFDWLKESKYITGTKYDQYVGTLKDSRDTEIAALIKSYKDAFDAIQDQYNRNISDAANKRMDYYSTLDGGIAWAKDAFKYGGILDALDYNPSPEFVTQVATDWAQDQHKAIRDSLNALQNELQSIVLPTGKQLSQYATGGFPEDGLFYANSKELVGRFQNGKTAVANNTQIIEGIKQGVLEALLQAGNNDGGNWTIQVVDTDGNIKAETIISAAERRNRRDGRTILPLGD